MIRHSMYVSVHSMSEGNPICFRDTPGVTLKSVG